MSEKSLNRRRSRTLNLDEATGLLRRPGCVLVEEKTNDSKFGRQFFVVPGGPVTDGVAKKILVHPLCHEVDAGLFRGIPQSYSLHFGDDAKREAHLSTQRRGDDG